LQSVQLELVGQVSQLVTPQATHLFGTNVEPPLNPEGHGLGQDLLLPEASKKYPGVHYVQGSVVVQYSQSAIVGAQNEEKCIIIPANPLES
jgi:hypothetical protein